MDKTHLEKRGFTLLEILLVVAAIAILAGIVIVAINPSKQLAETRNAQRRVDVETVLSGVYQYAIDNSGSLPGTIITSATCTSTAGTGICKGGACVGGTDLSALTLNQKYLTALPTDPTTIGTATGTGYFISKSNFGRITVCAPQAEQAAYISATR